MQGITPDYKITNLDSGKDITEILRPHIESLSLDESADSKTDTLTLRIGLGAIDRFPVSGTVIGLQIGYKETGLVDFGAYKVDTKTLSGMPMAMSIKAGATDFNAPYKSQKSREWDDVFLGDILSHIAKMNGLELIVDQELADIFMDYYRQNQESDMQLVAKLAHEHGAEGTIKSGKLVFKVKSKAAKVIDIEPSDESRFSLSWFDKPKYDCIVATWHDLNSFVSHEEVFDGRDFIAEPVGNVYRVDGLVNSQFHARKNAKSQFKIINEQALSGQLEMPGNPEIVSKLGLRLTGFNADVDGSILYVTRVNHSIGKSGFKTRIDAKTADQSS